MAGLLDRAMDWIANHAWKGYGTKVSSLGGRTSSNPYTFPSDGMLWLESNYRANSYIIAYVDGIKVAQPATPSSGSAGNFSLSIPVFKGQKVYFERANTYCYADFIPYKNMGGVSLTLIPAERRWRHERADRSRDKLLGGLCWPVHFQRRSKGHHLRSVEQLSVASLDRHRRSDEAAPSGRLRLHIRSEHRQQLGDTVCIPLSVLECRDCSVRIQFFGATVSALDTVERQTPPTCAHQQRANLSDLQWIKLVECLDQSLTANPERGCAA